MFVNRYSAFGGFSNGVAVDMAAIDQVKEREEKPEEIEEMEKLQPDTNSQFFNKGPDQWHSTTYIRTKEVYGKADLVTTPELAEDEPEPTPGPTVVTPSDSTTTKP
jgi:hypothetical protein